MKVVGIGTCALDLVFKLARAPTFKDIMIASSFTASPGGVVGNVLTGLARLGVEVGYIGKLGKDGFAQELLKYFSMDGVDYSKVVFSSVEGTEVVAVFVDERGGRSFVVYLGSTVGLGPEDVDLGYVRGRPFLFTDGIPLETALYVAKEVVPYGTKVFFSPAAPPSLYEGALKGSRDKFFELLKISDVFSSSYEISSEISEHKSIGELAKRIHSLGPRLVAITAGEGGCFVYNGLELLHVPAFKVNVVDTTGAGDAFNAGFLYGILKGLSLRGAAIVGSAAAAIKCTKLTAREGLPRLRQLKGFLASRGLSDLAEEL